MHIKSFLPGAACLLLFVSCQSTPPPQGPPPLPPIEKFSARADTAIETRLVLLNRELLRIDQRHAWAGHYYRGDGLGVNQRLSLAPTSGFAFTWHGNLGRYDHNVGKVNIVQGRLFVTCEWPNNKKGLRGLSEEFLPITWGQRHYLIDWTQRDAFCNAINAGREPRRQLQGMFFLRGDDHTKPTDAPPILPASMQSKIFSEPLQATITHVGETQNTMAGGLTKRTTYITLNVGAMQGVWQNMEFYLINARSVQTATVQLVDERTCEAQFVQIGEASFEPAIGQILSTRLRFMNR